MHKAKTKTKNNINTTAQDYRMRGAMGTLRAFRGEAKAEGKTMETPRGLLKKEIRLIIDFINMFKHSNFCD